MPVIYKIIPEPLWLEAQRVGTFTGAPVDVADGFIHFSTGEQVEETAARHFAGVSGLWLLAVLEVSVSDRLRWEPSRGGQLFPHLYGALPVDAVLWARPLPIASDGRHLFPQLEISTPPEAAGGDLGDLIVRSDGICD